MPLPFSRRGPNPFAMQQIIQRKQAEHIKKSEQEQDSGQDSRMKLYPLTPGTNPAINHARRGTNPVQPLPHHGVNPMRQQAPTPPQQNRHHPMQVAPPPRHNSQPPPRPEKAADQFRRVNQGLPDGVRYEPLDEDTMRLLKDNGHLKQASPPPANPVEVAQPQSPSSFAPPRTPMIPQPQAAVAPDKPSPPSLAPIILSGEIPKILQELAQDERNAQIFYSGISDAEPAKELLSSFAIDCGARLKQYLTLLADHCNHVFVPLETKINTNLDFAKAISLALTEENKTLVKLANLLDLVADTPAAGAIQRIINKKVAAYQLLLSIVLN